MKKVIFLVSLFFTANSFAFFNKDTMFVNTKYNICFTPGDDCTQLVVDTVGLAKKELLVQAYSFTSAPIAKAIVDAQNRGVLVKVILDKSQFLAKYSSAKFLQNHAIPVWNDDTVAIAHNKVMIIDSNVVITGSFNFTKAAQKKNAENLIVIYDSNLAQKFKNNWFNRQKVSEKIN